MRQTIRIEHRGDNLPPVGKFMLCGSLFFIVLMIFTKITRVPEQTSTVPAVPTNSGSYMDQ